MPLSSSTPGALLFEEDLSRILALLLRTRQNMQLPISDRELYKDFVLTDPGLHYKQISFKRGLL